MNSEIQRFPYISNHLYNNNSPYERVPSKKYTNNSRYNNNSFMKNNQNLNNSSLNFQKMKNQSFGKLPIKKGMFSYKNSLISSTPNNNFNNNNSSKKINKINYKFNNNNSLLSANLKLNLDNDDDTNNNNMSQNIIHGRIPSSSSFDLNKYKITDKSLLKLNRSQKKLSVGNIAKKSTYQKNSYYFNISQKNTDFNNNLIVNNNKVNRNSVDGVTNSPIAQKKMNSKEKDSPSLLIIDDIKDNNKENLNKINAQKRKIVDHFKYSSKSEKESRRMIIEYVKILNRYINKNKKILNIREIMTKNNISKKVLNKEITVERFNSSKLFNNSSINLNNKSTGKSLLNDSLMNNFNNSVINININKSKNFQSPIKNNINKFLTIMNDSKKDKIKMVKFLSVPRIMNLFLAQKKYKCICFICPNNISYVNGIESYIFKILDKNTYKVLGGFDLVKISICSINNKKPENFFIETYDGKINRNYQFETDLKDANYFVKSINYLSQLEKCKIYNNKNIIFNE